MLFLSACVSFIVPVCLLVGVSAFSFQSLLASLFVCVSANPEACIFAHLRACLLARYAFLCLFSHFVQFPVCIVEHLLICRSEYSIAAFLPAHLSLTFTSVYVFACMPTCFVYLGLFLLLQSVPQLCV